MIEIFDESFPLARAFTISRGSRSAASNTGAGRLLSEGLGICRLVGLEPRGLICGGLGGLLLVHHVRMELEQSLAVGQRRDLLNESRRSPSDLSVMGP